MYLIKRVIVLLPFKHFTVLMKDKILYFNDNFVFEYSETKKIVFTNGCFDLVHLGHLKLLEEAKKLGDYLIVGLNSNRSVKSLKGSQRPINDEYFRAYLLASLCSVDLVVIYDELTPERLVHVLKPKVLVKGGDYKKAEVVGGDYVESIEGEVVIFPTIEGFSSTSIIDRIKK